MHELPPELSSSLKSWRGSIYGASKRPASPDLEQGDNSATTDGKPLRPSHSSLILHPTKSRKDLRNSGQASGDVPQSSANNAVAQRPNDNARVSSPAEPQSIFTAPKVDDPDPAADRLQDNGKPLQPEHFYALMGMLPPVISSHGQIPEPPRKIQIPHGLYGRIRDQYEYTQTKYRVYDILVYAFLVLQILLSAVFIVLGGLKVESHAAIVVLGAISTVIGGALALMKGQGLPNRLRQLRDQLQNVLFEVDELYADVMAGKPVLFKDVSKVRQDYLRVMEEARQNHPDTWNSTAGKIGIQDDKSGKAGVAVIGSAKKQ